MRNKIVLLVFVLNLIPISAMSNEIKERTYDYPWTERHEVLTEYVSKYKNRIKEYTPYKIKKSRKFLAEIEKIMIEEGVPRELAILAAIESGFNINAISQANAVGMWQFRKETAKDWGLTVNSNIDDRKDWKKASRAAAKYLKWLAEENFNGDYESAILSYNAGVGKVTRIMKDLNVTDPWIIIEDETLLPLESREFLPKYITFMHYFYYLKDSI